MTRACALLALALALRAASAHAAAEGANVSDCDYRPIAGTVPFQTAILARQSHAAAFGVGRFIEDLILPELGDGAPFVYSFRMQSMGPTTRLPSFATNPGCPGSSVAGDRFVDDRYASTFTTQSSASVGFGISQRWELAHVSFIYAGNITASRLFTGKFQDNFVGHVVGLQGVYAGLAAPPSTARSRTSSRTCTTTSQRRRRASRAWPTCAPATSARRACTRARAFPSCASRRTPSWPRSSRSWRTSAQASSTSSAPSASSSRATPAGRPRRSRPSTARACSRAARSSRRACASTR